MWSGCEELDLNTPTDQIRSRQANPSSHLRPSGPPRGQGLKPVTKGPDSVLTHSRASLRNWKANHCPIVCGDELCGWEARCELLLFERYRGQEWSPETLPVPAFRRVRGIPGLGVGSSESIHLLQPAGHKSSVRDYDLYLIHGWLWGNTTELRLVFRQNGLFR